MNGGPQPAPETTSARSRHPAPWAPLDLAEANRLLRQGEYGLRVEEFRSGFRLTGRGAGLGVPIDGGADGALTWLGISEVLSRLRRTRQTHDPSWLDGLARSLAEPGTDCPEWTDQGSARPEWTGLEPERVRRQFVDELPEQVRGCLDSLVEPGGAVRFPADALARRDGRWPALADLTGDPADRSVRLQTTSGGTPLTAEGVRERMRSWELLSSAVDGDPVLRMHCATQPVPASLIDARTDSAVLARLVEPAPPHPAYPGGTFVVALHDLVRPRPGGPLLGHVLRNRSERRAGELDHFAEHFVRPLLRTFRHALDQHDIGLCSLGGTGVGFELSAELQASGRVVVTEYGGVLGRPADAAEELRAGVRTLMTGLDALCAAFGELGLLGPASRELAESAVERVTAEELRYLSARSAGLLAAEPRVRRFVHTVPAAQDEALKDVLSAVQERTRQRRWNPDQPQPAVVIDLDLCGTVPWQRTLEATRAVSGPRPGAPDGVLELARPSALRVLPTRAETTWHDFVHSNGLEDKYPQVDWRAVHRDFVRVFDRPERLRTDVINAGLARFVWDVQDAGGRVVLCTGRRERFREQALDVLRAGGVPDAQLLCVGDDRTRPEGELKIAALRALRGIELVALFDDLAEDRTAFAKEFPGAKVLAVEVPGLAAERCTEQPTPDGAAAVATFETSPRPERAQPSLSNTHSLEELQVGALRNNRLANRWAVRLSTEESMSLVDSILADADRAAARTCEGARAKFLDGLPDEPPATAELDHSATRSTPGTANRADAVIRAMHHVFTRKQFLKGSRGNYQVEDMRRDVETFVRNDQPVEVVLLGFPVKQCLSRLKAAGPLPDLAEFGALVRLREMQRAVRAVHPPGLHFNLLTDGRHFRPRPASVTDAYQNKLRQYVELAGIGDCTTVEEIDELAEQRLGPQVPAERAERFARHCKVLRDELSRFDITDNPLRTIEAVEEFASGADLPVARMLALFREIMTSLVYSVGVRFPDGVDRLAWSSAVYADIYNLTDPAVSQQVRDARAGVLRRAWDTVIRYLATLQVDEDLGYDGLVPQRVRLTVSAAKPGRCGFTYLGGSGLLPWQGTGALDDRGRVGVDFAVSLYDRGFVPVHSPLLGPRQPWFMVPAQRTLLDQRYPGSGSRASSGLRLDPEFAAKARLRRK